MKTQHSREAVAEFLKDHEGADPASVRPLVEGHSSQAFKFMSAEGWFVCRLAGTDNDFQADLFACDHFATRIPIPAVKTIDKYADDTFYCITGFAPGKTSNILSDEEMDESLPDIHRVLYEIFSIDISFSEGFGDIDTASGNAKYDTWVSRLRNIQMTGKESFKRNAENIGLEGRIVDVFFDQFESNLQYASEMRRLLHGDPAFDNMLVENNKVTAVIDWAQMGYGDWMSDFARLDFWWPNRYGDAKEFADAYGLESDNINERKALYWATNALWTIEFADKAKSKSVTEWLNEHIKEKVV